MAAPPEGRLARWSPWALLAALLVLPYPRLLTFRAVNLADDIFIADLLGAELPIRAAVGRALRSGHLPLWEPDIYTGYPLAAGGGALDPIGGVLFALLSPAAAYDAFLLAMLAVAGFGAARLARLLGASRSGAVLAGLVWAHGGVLISQWRHLGVLGTIAWFPLGLSLVEDALGPVEAGPRRDRALVAFSAMLGLQVLAAFPQSLYYCLLGYGLWALVRAWSAHEGLRPRAVALGRFTLACMVGVALGAVQLLPMAELGGLSGRRGGVSWEFATSWVFWPPNLLGLVVPYPFGDIGEGTYRGTGVFWESHGYLGLCAVPLAVVALWADRRRAVKTLGVIALLALLFTLGPATPLYRVAFTLLPGMSSFRLPQRMLFVACGALAVLAGLGLTRAQRWWSERLALQASRLSPTMLGVVLVALTAVDLGLTQPRQNPLADAAPWLSPPPTALAMRRDGVERFYTMESSTVHDRAFALAHGWRDLRPYAFARDLIQPDANLLWSLGSADGYAGLPTEHMDSAWGPTAPNHDGLVRANYRIEGDHVVPHGALVRYLAMNHVTHVLAPVEVRSQRLEAIPSGSWPRLYRVRDPLPLVYFIGEAIAVTSDRHAAAWMFSERFSPRREAILHDQRAGALPVEPTAGPATLVAAAYERRGPGAIVASVDAPTAGWLIVAESWYPGWVATLDGREVAVVRANINQKAVAVPAGRHRVVWEFRPRSLRRGAWVSGVALIVLLAAAVAVARGRDATRGAPVE